jgi:hypothetical protein
MFPDDYIPRKTDKTMPLTPLAPDSPLRRLLETEAAAGTPGAQRALDAMKQQPGREGER